METKLELPRPTSQTIKGPLINLMDKNLTLGYDYENDNGTIDWVKIIFLDVLTFNYRQNSCVLPEDVKAYNVILDLGDSLWLNTNKQIYEKFLGKSHIHQGFNYKHWKIYFDDVACVEIIAREFQIVNTTGENE